MIRRLADENLLKIIDLIIFNKIKALIIEAIAKIILKLITAS